MIITLISIFLALVTFSIVTSFFTVISAILPALAVLLISFIVLSRKLAQRIEPVMKDIQNNIMNNKIEIAIKQLKMLKNNYGKWQFFLSSSIDGQIGSILYIKSSFNEAKPYLQKSFMRNWVAKAMLALIYYREKKYKEMEEVFASLTKVVKKSGLLWSLWAYCNWRLDNTQKALDILAKGKTYLKDQDPYLTQNLLSLQNDKKMKMRLYGEQWYQFLLESTPQQMQLKQGKVRFKSR